MDDGLVIVLIVAGMAGLFWSAWRYDAAVKRYKAQQAVTDELQEKSQQQLAQVDAQQRRQTEILNRQEALLARAEAIASRLEKNPLA